MRPHPIQHALWTTDSRFVAAWAGRGSGKTELAKRRLVKAALRDRKPWRDRRYFYGAPTQDQAVRIAWDDLLALLPAGSIAAISLSKHLIRLRNGAELWVIGMDKPQRAEGTQWDGGVLDESSDLKPKIVDRNLGPAMTHRRAWLWRIGVPKRQGIGASEFREFCERATSGEDPEMAGFTWPSRDILPASEIKLWQRRLDPKDFREQYEACWETAGGAIFYAFDRAQNVRPCPYNPDLPIVVGSDFNVDPMAWVLGHAYHVDDADACRMEWFDEIWMRDTNTPAALDALHGRYGSHRGGFRFYGDATGRARKTSASRSDYQTIEADERFKALGRHTHYPRKNPAVIDRFAACNAMFCNAAGQRRMFVDPRCKNLLKDIEGRYYKPGTREPADSGDLGHPTDAMGYPTLRLFPIRVSTYEEDESMVGGAVIV